MEKKVGSPGDAGIQAQTCLTAKGIYPHFSDEEAEAETCLEAGAQVGRCLSPEEQLQNPQGPEKQGRDQPSGSPAREAQRHREACVGHAAIRSQLLPSTESGVPGRPFCAQLVARVGDGVPDAGYPERGDPRLGIGDHLSSWRCDLGQATCPL